MSMRANITKRIIICAGLLVVGVSGMLALANLKTPPAEAPRREHAIRVEVIKARATQTTVEITGFGQAEALNTVSIASEVSGRVVHTHPRLEVGEMIPEGETLFEIDSVNYQAAVSEARSSVEKWADSIRILEKKYALEQERLKTLQRSQNLARAEYSRLRELFESDQVGTRSRVDAAEQAYNATREQADAMAQAVALYPLQISEARSSLSAARAGLAVAEANLARCRVLAPFNARVKKVSLETGQYLSPGMEVLTLADDSVLEITVPIDSRDARKWLLFDRKSQRKESAWFSNLSPVTCEIRWTEETDGHLWEGVLHRVVKLDQNTRTLHVAVRVAAGQALSKTDTGLPLVEGMFCSVKIPGKTLENVFEVPRWAVSYENQIYMAQEHRLKTVPVDVVRIQGESALVSAGIEEGDLIITTRLANPLENSLLTFSEPSSKKEAS